MSVSVQHQRGITGLETAIILIAFVVVASVFAFTVLTAGVFATERSKETAYAGLEEATTTMVPRGGLIAIRGDVDGTDAVTKLTFTIGVTGDSESVDLTPPYVADDTGTDPDDSGLAHTVTIAYTDSSQHIIDVPWTTRFLGGNNGDYILEGREMAEITVWLHQLDTGTGVYSLGTSSDNFLNTRLGINGSFGLTVDASRGATVNLARVIPAKLTPTMDLR